jgi:hypothetical protein
MRRSVFRLNIVALCLGAVLICSSAGAAPHRVMDLRNQTDGGCPGFCVNGFSFSSATSGLQTGW